MSDATHTNCGGCGGCGGGGGGGRNGEKTERPAPVPLAERRAARAAEVAAAPESLTLRARCRPPRRRRFCAGLALTQEWRLLTVTPDIARALARDGAIDIDTTTIAKETKP